MFTGIIQAVGILESSSQHESGRRLCIDIGELPAPFPGIGDSVSVSGACLTVTELDGKRATFDVSTETLDRCLVGNWIPGQAVNLEKALTLQTPLGGHLVSGHVDGIGSVSKIRSDGPFTEMGFRIDTELGMFVARKGSIAIDGVSLTVNGLEDSKDGTRFDLMLVPHTLEQTTLGSLAVGDAVHVEVDQVARYVQRLGKFGYRVSDESGKKE